MKSRVDQSNIERRGDPLFNKGHFKETLCLDFIEKTETIPQYLVSGFHLLKKYTEHDHDVSAKINKLGATFETIYREGIIALVQHKKELLELMEKGHKVFGEHFREWLQGERDSVILEEFELDEKTTLYLYKLFVKCLKEPPTKESLGYIYIFVTIYPQASKYVENYILEFCQSSNRSSLKEK